MTGLAQGLDLRVTDNAGGKVSGGWPKPSDSLAPLAFPGVLPVESEAGKGES